MEICWSVHLRVMAHGTMTTDGNTVKRLLARIKREFPDVQWTSVRIKDEGWNHFAVILDNSVVFRVPKYEEKRGYFGDEIALLELVAKHTSVRVPRVTHVSRDSTIMGYSYLPGDELNASAVELFDEELLRIVSEELALFLGDLHEISPKAWQDLAVRKTEHERLSSGYHEQLQGRLPDEECEVIENYLQDLEFCESSCSTRVLLHGDLALCNVILDRKERRLSIIDFTDWRIGDPACDFSDLYDSPTLVREVFQKYRHKGDCDGLLARTEVYNRGIPIFMMIGSFQGYPVRFDESYREFKRVFGIADKSN